MRRRYITQGQLERVQRQVQALFDPVPDLVTKLRNPAGTIEWYLVPDGDPRAGTTEEVAADA